MGRVSHAMTAWAEPLPAPDPNTSRTSTSRTIQGLQDGPTGSRLVSWLVTMLLTAASFALSLVHLRRPKGLVFDETYYPKDAWTMLHLGYEGTWPENYPGNAKLKNNDAIAQGLTDGYTKAAEFVVHPPLGKWLIAAGEHLFGMNSFGWRISSALFGAIMVAAVVRLARRLSRSTLVGGIAGLLLVLDGLHFSMSRIGLLDIFQATFLVLAVSCCVADRDWFRNKLAAHLVRTEQPDLDGRYGPRLWFRPWRALAGIWFGCAMAVKWNSMFVLAAFGVLAVIWDLTGRRQAGARSRSWLSVVGDGIPAFVQLVVLAIPVYTASWAGWFATQGGWDRQWGHAEMTSSAFFMERHHDTFVRFLGAPLTGWLWYHQEMYRFHTGDGMMNATHVYEANPWGWLVMYRPIGIDAVNDIKPGVDGCTAVNDTCLRVISGAGTPILWWLALVALVASLWFWIAGRDWRFGVPIVAAMSTYLPWFKYADRPLFFFYAICIIPFTVTLLAMCLGKLIGPATAPDRKKRSWLAGGAIALVAANFAFIYPILTDQLLTRKAWLARMWFRSWI